MRPDGHSGRPSPPTRSNTNDGARSEAPEYTIDPPPTTRTFGGRRSGVCPLAENLKTVDAIMAAQKAGCATVAREALNAYIAAKGG